MSARRPFLASLFPKTETQRMAALRWLSRHRVMWVGKKVERYEPMRVSYAWWRIVSGLQDAGIYSPLSCPWDIRIDALVLECESILFPNKRR